MCYILAMPPLGPVDNPTWWECVAQHRLRLGLTKAELATLCGISRMTLYRIETGKYEASETQVRNIESALYEYAALKAVPERVA